MSTVSATPWWQTSLKITAVVVALVLVALYAPWPFNAVAVLAALIFLLVALANPEHWLRWLARACVVGATGSAVLPDFAAQFEIESGFVDITKNGAIAYALLIAGVAFAALDVWRERSAGTTEVRDEPKDRLERDIKAYFTSAIERHKKIELAGFQTKVRTPIRLEDLHVPLRAMLDHDPRERDPVFSAVEAHTSMVGHVRELLLTEAFEFAQHHGELRGLVILGDPGSGKTTHLKRLLLKIAHDGAASLGLAKGTVPVFLPLRNLVDLDVGLDAFIECELSGPHLVTPQRFGERLKTRGRVLYLLDGLDEVRDAGQRAKVSRWIDAALKASPNSVFVVTCRYAGYADARLSAEFLELHLRPLDDTQVEQFVRRWFEIVETHLLDGRARKQAIESAQERAAKLLADLRQPALQASARVAELTHNPLLLTAICLVHYDRGKLPERRSELYDECVAVLLERWNEAKALKTRIPAIEARMVLQPLAWWMHCEDERTLARADEMEPQVRQALSRTKLEVEAEVFLRSIRDESGLLTGWGIDQYGFMHLGFQEYLTAREILSREFAEAGALAQLAGRFGESWWQEVILLLLAQQDLRAFDKFMAELVKRPEFPEWATSQMMGLCMTEAAGVSARPFEALLRKSGDNALGSQQLAAAQVLARSLPEALDRLDGLLETHPAEAVRTWWRTHQWQQGRGGEKTAAPRGGVELVWIPGGRFLMGEGTLTHEVELASFYLARTPVTNQQYLKFLEQRPEFRKPTWWAERRFNQPEQPVVGVSWDDAMAYCEWAGLSLPTEAQWEYACRAGTMTRYSSGDSEADLARVGWYASNSSGRLHAVAELEPNVFGLYDMHGNVEEWCMDTWGRYEVRSPRAGDGLRYEPVGGTFTHHVIRGGSWGVDARSARSGCRGKYPPGSRFASIGFRPARGINCAS
jgi:formylglycine-generating enzyme required for sulfatase activity